MLSRPRGPLASILATAVLVFSLGATASCGSDSGSGRVISVPGDAASIQEAVDRAESGDLVLIEAGTYHESVVVSTPRITIRGVDRNEVVLDGRYELPNGFEVTSDGVAVENLTVHSFRQNGVIVSGAYRRDADASIPVGTTGNSIRGFRVSYVTAYNNGLYGVYSFAAQDGLIENVYASGHPDSGIYVGQCKPCNTVLRSVVAENNAIGYYGTNASGNVWVVESVFRGNRLGVAPNSQSTEKLAPQEDAVIAGNLVVDNDNVNAPEIPMGFFSGGIVVGAGTRNTIARNRVSGHSWAGIAVMPMNSYRPEGNRVTGNVMTDNGLDLVYIGSATDGDGNCFSDNSYASSAPESIEEALSCANPTGLARPSEVDTQPSSPGPDYRTLPAPPAQPSMPDARTAPRTVADGPPAYPDLEAIVVPDVR